MNDRAAIVFREIPESDIDRAQELAYLVFHEKPEDELRKRHHELLAGCLRIGAYDAETLVGMVAALPFTMAVPGAELPCPSLTFVSVAPTHRRRGVLSGMIAELFARCPAEGWPMAALWASETAIYGRFGFGPGTYGATVEIDSREALRLRIAPDERPLRLVDPAAAPALLGPYYDRTRSGRAGRPERSEEWWAKEWMVEQDPDDEDFSRPRVVALGAPLAGYAVYRTKDGDSDRPETSGLVRLDELEADTPAVAAALWRYLTSLDLTGTVRAWGRPLDDPLLLFAADRDQVRVTSTFPALWVRLLDVGTALRRRSWAAAADVVLAVTDAAVPANEGTYRLTVAPGAPAAYESVDAAPDLTVDVRDLSAAYLGGTTLAAAVRAGLATEHTAGATDALDAALRTPLLPHTVEEF